MEAAGSAFVRLAVFLSYTSQSGSSFPAPKILQFRQPPPARSLRTAETAGKTRPARPLLPRSSRGREAPDPDAARTRPASPPAARPSLPTPAPRSLPCKSRPTPRRHRRSAPSRRMATANIPLPNRDPAGKIPPTRLRSPRDRHLAAVSDPHRFTSHRLRDLCRSSRGHLVENEYYDRAETIRLRITQLRDSL
jgi:hypothetical protein